ncbi:hypothetical protein ALP22_200254 [Pseudomonas coronafaciens pv. porri]|nr:hypothetical protein ALP22_200254 [Pseudomonas coronafaciens pv. porri]
MCGAQKTVEQILGDGGARDIGQVHGGRPLADDLTLDEDQRQLDLFSGGLIQRPDIEVGLDHLLAIGPRRTTLGLASHQLKCLECEGQYCPVI